MVRIGIAERLVRRVAAVGLAALLLPGGTLAQPFAYITNRLSDDVPVIDTATNTVVETIALGAGDEPVGVAVSPDGSRVYVTNASEDSVSVIQTATNDPRAAAPMPGSLFFLRASC